MQPVLFLSHGGGPLPLLGDPGHEGMVQAFSQIRDKLQQQAPQPDALLFVSAHWETASAQITAAANPSIIYDYYGFPEESYSLQYPVAGAPEVARQVKDALQEAGIPALLDVDRGLDHGVFVPGLILFPEAGIPCLQVSVLNSLDSGQHLELGRALAGLRERNVMIIGSGFSFHNLREFFGKGDPQADKLNFEFEQWLSETVMDNDAEKQNQRLLDWQQAPGARFCHPREEHLMPLHVCAGAAENARADQAWRFEVLGKQGSCYWWA